MTNDRKTPSPHPSLSGPKALLIVLLAGAVLLGMIVVAMRMVQGTAYKPMQTEKMLETMAKTLQAYAAEYGGQFPPAVPMFDIRNPDEQFVERRLDRVRTYRIPSLTTPVAFFTSTSVFDPYDLPRQTLPLAYIRGEEWALIYSAGPDLEYTLPSVAISSEAEVAEVKERIERYRYDPTNGLKSEGDIIELVGPE